MIVILIGYRGSGKTTIGKLLADQLWKDFVDVDAKVCARFGADRTVASIWAEHGEQAWRDAEAEVITSLCDGSKDDIIIALGGGALTHPDGRLAVENAKNATRIYLECDPDELDRRIKNDKQTAESRPDLTDLGGGEEEIRKVLLDREPAYVAVADQVFDVTHVDARSAARYLIDRCLR